MRSQYRQRSEGGELRRQAAAQAVEVKVPVNKRGATAEVGGGNEAKRQANRGGRCCARAILVLSPYVTPPPRPSPLPSHAGAAAKCGGLTGPSAQ